jgi:hypothetical protein
MKRLVLSDVKNLHEYELIRDDWRRDVIAEKARRRVFLGPSMSVVFENRLTVLNQVQEMCRAERIVRPEAVQNEIDVYNELLPGPGEIAATLMIEITEVERVQPELDGLVGLGNGDKLYLDVAGRRVYARFLEGQGREDRISAVQYLRFPIGDDVCAELAAGDRDVRLVVDHPSYRASTPLPVETKQELARDLRESAS